MRQSEREHILGEIAVVRKRLDEAQALIAQGLKQIAELSVSLNNLLSELSPWVSIAEVCDMQQVSIETALRDCYYLPNFGVQEGPKGWRRDTVRHWIASLDERRRQWAFLHGDRKEEYRAQLRGEVA